MHWGLCIFFCLSAAVQGWRRSSRCFVQLALGDICAPRQHHLLPDLLGPTMAKKALCTMFAQRQTHHSKHSCFFKWEKKIEKGEEWWNQHEANFAVPWRLCFVVKGRFSSTLPWWTSHSKRGGHQWQVGLMGLERKIKELGGVKLKTLAGKAALYGMFFMWGFSSQLWPLIKSSLANITAFDTTFKKFF